MRWKRNTGFDQIEDRRGQGGGSIGFPTGGGGGGIPIPIPGGKAGGGLGTIIVVVVLFLLFSGVLGGSGSIPGMGGLSGGAAEPGGTLDPQSDTDQQLAYIVDSIQTFWASTFEASGRDYPETKLVLFEGGTQSSCGPASSATGPFYCPADQKVYLDLGFFDELKSRFGAEGGDFAMAYVVAHEFGHHVQMALGISEQVEQFGAQDPSRRNDLSVRQELQADCLAGVWANSSGDIQEGDIPEALSAASAVGDDRIQESTTGRVDPESWTHGSAEQREAWFTRGYRSGTTDDCDTFAQ
jgi:predicted metalloprotease